MTRRLACLALFAIASSAHAQTPARWRLEPTATIEGASAADPFGVIRGLALHRDGRLVVVELAAKRVTAFDAQGRPLGKIGRDGSGPGEYRLPYYAAWLADTIGIFDPGESRVVYLTNGQVPLRVTPSERLTGGIDVRFYPVSPTKAYLFGVRRAGNKLERVFIGYDGSGARDTVAVPEMPALPSGAICKRSDGGITFFSWLEAPRRFAFPVRADGAMAIGSTGEYAVAIQSRAGAALAVIRRDIVAPALPDSAWNAGNADYEKHVAKFGAASCDATPVRPAHRAPIRAITVADDGDLWITALGTGGRVFDVFSPDGRYRATVPAPEYVENLPIVVAGNRLALVAEDASGAQVVRLYRVVK
jgi:hypothetical protein